MKNLYKVVLRKVKNNSSFKAGHSYIMQAKDAIELFRHNDILDASIIKFVVVGGRS